MSTISNQASIGAVAPDTRGQPSRAPAAGAALQGVGGNAGKAPVLAKAQIQFDPKKMAEELDAAIERLNKQMEANKRGLGFSVDKQLNMTIVTVKDANTGEVVRQIPSDVVIHVAHRIEDMKGILFSKQA